MAHILVIVLAAAAWIAFLYASPFGACLRCHGRGTVRKGRRVIVCPSCHGRKRAQRPGSRTVHRLARRVGAEVARTRQERAERASREDQP
jgi:cytochrome c553